MSILTDARHACLEPGLANSPRSLIRWVSCNNPFYAISALMVCLGLWVSFGGQAQAAQTWALMAGMTGYTLLLAGTACLLVRFLGVWDDVRTVMLLAVLMFLATSVTFDEVLAVAPQRGVGCCVGGLAFAVTVSEGMLHGARLTLPLAFRLPYLLMLALFFLYPAALAPLLEYLRNEELEWALSCFSPAAGLVVLTLLPAIRRGRAYVRDNGSPWPWAGIPGPSLGCWVSESWPARRCSAGRCTICNAARRSHTFSALISLCLSCSASCSSSWRLGLSSGIRRFWARRLPCLRS